MAAVSLSDAWNEPSSDESRETGKARQISAKAASVAQVIAQDEDDEGKIFINAEQGEVEGDHKACFSVAGQLKFLPTITNIGAFFVD